MVMLCEWWVAGHSCWFCETFGRDWDAAHAENAARERLDSCTCGDLGRDPECEVHGGPDPYDGLTRLGTEQRDRRWRFVATKNQCMHSTSGVYAWKHGGWALGEHSGWSGWKPVGASGADLQCASGYFIEAGPL